MDRFRRSFLPALALILQPAALCLAVDVTVYNQDLALIRETRPFALQAGANEVKVTEVAARIDATSVHFKSLTAPDGVAVIEQNFQYDLISQDKLLGKYLGREIELERFLGVGGDKRETVRGTLLSNSGGRVLRVGDKIFLNPPGNPVLPDLPEGLLTRPTLLWRLHAAKGGEHQCEISYLTGGMGWRSDYILVSNPDDTKLDLNAWVTIDNNSGATYKDARLKLVAGDVHRAEAERIHPTAKARRALDMAAAAPQFEERAFFEYHLYTLGRPTTLRENETKQIQMASAAEVPVRKRFFYDGAQGLAWGQYSSTTRSDPNYGTQSDKKVAVALEFKNSKDNNLGLPLPRGRVRVYKKDKDGSLEFIGEDAIDHTPKDEKVRIKMGNAFDLVGERKRTNYESKLDKDRFEESFEIRLRNHKDSEATVTVVERLYRWTNWKVPLASHPWTKQDAQTIEFEVPVPKDGEAVVTYTVRYSW